MSIYPEEFKALEEENGRLKEELEDYHNTEKFVLSEDCPTDENHCGCVVILKKRIKDQALAKLKEEPEQGEFTKNIMANLERWDLLPKEKDCRIRTIIVWLKEVCYRYDYLVKRNAELQAENKQLVDGQVAKKGAGS